MNQDIFSDGAVVIKMILWGAMCKKIFSLILIFGLVACDEADNSLSNSLLKQMDLAVANSPLKRGQNVINISPIPFDVYLLYAHPYELGGQEAINYLNELIGEEKTKVVVDKYGLLEKFVAIEISQGKVLYVAIQGENLKYFPYNDKRVLLIPYKSHNNRLKVFLNKKGWSEKIKFFHD